MNLLTIENGFKHSEHQKYIQNSVDILVEVSFEISMSALHDIVIDFFQYFENGTQSLALYFYFIRHYLTK